MDAMINGIRMRYADSGPAAGCAVVLLHAFPLSHATWSEQLAALTPAFRVVTPDLRGFGGTDAGDGQYTLEFFVDDLVGLLDHLKLSRVAVCGLSMGGYIALRAVERNPERFCAVILCDTRSEADSNDARLGRAAALKTVKQAGLAAFSEKFVRTVFAPGTLASKPALIESTKKLIQSNSPLGICGALLAMASRTDTTAALPDIRVPALVMVGEHDALTPPALARAMQGKIPDARLRLIPDAAHMSNLENPQEFNRHLLEFLHAIPPAVAAHGEGGGMSG
jgi:3-oxoadipate enol-lactonase